MKSKTCSTPRDLRYALAEADASFKSTMQARGTDWVALSNGHGQIARSPAVKEVKPLELSHLSDLASLYPTRLPLDCCAVRHADREGGGGARSPACPPLVSCVLPKRKRRSRLVVALSIPGRSVCRPSPRACPPRARHSIDGKSPFRANARADARSVALGVRDHHVVAHTRSGHRLSPRSTRPPSSSCLVAGAVSRYTRPLRPSQGAASK